MFFDTLLWPIMVAVAWIMVQFHSLFTWMGLGTDSGVSWSLSIVGLVVVIRILLIPLFVKQIKASRGLQIVQPEIQKLQAKYKGKTDPASRQAMQAEMMQIYKEAGTNPFASCLPILAQSPIFFALFNVLNRLPALADGTFSETRDSIGPLTAELAASAEQSTVFGAPLASTFMRAAEFPDPAAVRVVTVVLIILMSATTFTTQRQLTMKNMPAAALDNPMARQQKMLMYVLPIVFAVSGVNFPIGVLLYWFTTNIWSMGQQFYVIRNMPAPGSAAEQAYKARKAKRAARRGKPVVEATPETPAEPAKPVNRQRQQPVRKDRQKPSSSTGSGAAKSPSPPNRPATSSGSAKQGGGSSAANRAPSDGNKRVGPDAHPSPAKKKKRPSPGPGSQGGSSGSAGGTAGTQRP